MEDDITKEKVRYERSATVDRFEGKLAVLLFDDGQQLNWPIKNLPDDVQEGAKVRLVVSSAISAEEERKKLAKELINEILAS